MITNTPYDSNSIRPGFGFRVMYKTIQQKTGIGQIEDVLRKTFEGETPSRRLVDNFEMQHKARMFLTANGKGDIVLKTSKDGFLGYKQNTVIVRNNEVSSIAQKPDNIVKSVTKTISEYSKSKSRS